MHVQMPLDRLLCRLASVGCRGFRVNPYQECWAHLDHENRQRALSHLRPRSSINAYGTHLTTKLLNDILGAMRRDNGPPELGNAQFDQTVFDGDAQFNGAEFTRSASFNGAKFSGDAWFEEAQFTERAQFKRAQFDGDAQFDGAQFRWRASLGKAHLQGCAEFREVQFRGDASFNRARFFDHARFRGARFLGNARFMGAQFDGDARLEEAHFEAERVLGPVLVKGRLALDETTVSRHLYIEALACQFTCIETEFYQGATIRLQWADVVLDRCIFGRPTTISFAQLPFRERRGGATPEGGLGPELFSLKPPMSPLEPIVLPSRRPVPVAQTAHLLDSALCDSQETSDLRGQRRARRRFGGSRFRKKEKAYKQVEECKPRLLSMRGVNVSNLTLVELDLSQCIFQGAHKRAELRIIGARPFVDTPKDRVWPSRRIRLFRRWTRRQALAEEHRWRRLTRSLGRWYPPECRSPPWLAKVTGQKVDRLNPERLASIYRALRKAQEDSKNQPGAADFYYGEMEMRRVARSTPRAERCILTLYWLISGYSLRGVRTLLALLVLLAVATGLIAKWGFPDPKPVTTFTATIVGTRPRQSVQVEPQPAATVTTKESFGKRLGMAAVMALEGAAFRAPEQELNYKGRIIQNLVRIVGPILIGLTLLSVRNRVKR
jgi:uncharacterized protein YjbI with pentapeptide repeats